ncbi:hypothetical protein TELCIR_07290 [Teladorsagia circumcincta]|uniref:SXP/RAL-2 family protein Ani s 5-like cation-binding domain-containing protein n=1 Tax=Teladorsagia circumcincta TaxID=45464 RepID=A0A2G9UMY7_TELCI|nr:hypothetical protein TELCIR_07290 [Teladorsagia circumcincta]
MKLFLIVVVFATAASHEFDGRWRHFGHHEHHRPHDRHEHDGLHETREDDGPHRPRGPHGPHGPHGPPLPPYLEDVSEEARKEYFEIVFDDALTVREQKEKIREWAKANDMEEQMRIFDKHMEKVRKNVKKLIKYLPTALRRLSELVEDENLTPREIGEKRHELTATYPEAFHVLKFAFEQFMQRNGPHGPLRDGLHGRRWERHHSRHGDERHNESGPEDPGNESGSREFDGSI